MLRRIAPLLIASTYAWQAGACGPMYGPNGGKQQPPAQTGNQTPSGPPGGGDPNVDPNTAFPQDPYGADQHTDQRAPQPDPRPDQWTKPQPPPPPDPPAPDPWATRAPQPPPAPEPPPPPPPPPKVGPQPAKLAGEWQTLLDAHNADRAQHCAAPLTWSPKLEQVAQGWANSLRDQGCKFGHSGGSYGENLAAGTSGTLDGNSVAAMWYDEIKDYDFRSGGFSMNTGHFTQVVWRATTSVGCGKATCRGMDIYVCNYDPPGNVEGDYRKNVQPKGCK